MSSFGTANVVHGAPQPLLSGAALQIGFRTRRLRVSLGLAAAALIVGGEPLLASRLSGQSLGIVARKARLVGGRTRLHLGRSTIELPACALRLGLPHGHIGVLRKRRGDADHGGDEKGEITHKRVFGRRVGGREPDQTSRLATLSALS